MRIRVDLLLASRPLDTQKVVHLQNHLQALLSWAVVLEVEMSFELLLSRNTSKGLLIGGWTLGVEGFGSLKAIV